MYADTASSCLPVGLRLCTIVGQLTTPPGLVKLHVRPFVLRPCGKLHEHGRLASVDGSISPSLSEREAAGLIEPSTVQIQACLCKVPTSCHHEFSLLLPSQSSLPSLGTLYQTLNPKTSNPDQYKEGITITAGALNASISVNHITISAHVKPSFLVTTGISDLSGSSISMSVPIKQNLLGDQTHNGMQGSLVQGHAS